MIKNENIQFLIHKFNEDKLAHVFLVETNYKEYALKDIKEFIKVLNCTNQYKESCEDCNLCHLIEENALPSLKIIYPDGQVIKKQQMEELKLSFSSIPFLTKYNTYIVIDAEKLNASSANTMLKFIEEPEENIIGFLIADNKENVIETIKSRCEIIKAYYEDEKENINERIQNLAVHYLYQLEVEKKRSIVYNRDILNENLEKNDLCIFFQSILKIYESLLNHSLQIETLGELKKLSQKDLLKRIELVSDMLNKLYYNVNINLLLDSFVLRLED